MFSNYIYHYDLCNLIIITISRKNLKKLIPLLGIPAVYTQMLSSRIDFFRKGKNNLWLSPHARKRSFFTVRFSLGVLSFLILFHFLSFFLCFGGFMLGDIITYGVSQSITLFHLGCFKTLLFLFHFWQSLHLY